MIEKGTQCKNKESWNALKNFIHNHQKLETTLMSLKWWIYKLVHPYNEVLFSNVTNEFLIHTTTWVNHKCVTLSQRSWSQKAL